VHAANYLKTRQTCIQIIKKSIPTVESVVPLAARLGTSQMQLVNNPAKAG